MQIAIILKAPFIDVAVEEDIVIYADGAYKHKDKIGKKTVLAVVGDFDSLGAPPKNENTVDLNVEKDFTDGERAVRYAVEKGATKIVIYGAYGGNIDHVLGNITLLKIAKELGVNAIIKDKNTNTELISKKVKINAKKGGVVSIIPYGGDCSFNDSNGLYYTLKGVNLTIKDTRGISNKAISDSIEIDVDKGEALIVYQR